MANCTKTRCHEPQKAPPASRTTEIPKPVPSSVRREMEPTFGCDLTHLKVHDGAKGDQVASQYGARAVTLGGQIYFGRGEYQPKTTEGRQVLAHEAAHAVQQSKSGPATQSTSELEAEAHLAASGERSVSLSAASPLVPLTLRRGERPTGPPSRGLSRSIRRHLERDPNDETGVARRQLGALAPRVRSEVAEQVRDHVTPDQRVSLHLDSHTSRGPSSSRTGPAELGPDLSGQAGVIRGRATSRRSDGAPVAPATETHATPGTSSQAAHPAAGSESHGSPVSAGTNAPSNAPHGHSPAVHPIAATPSTANAQRSPAVSTASVIAPGSTPAGGAPATGGPGVGIASGSPSGGPMAVAVAPPSPPSAPAPDQNPAFQGVRHRVGTVAAAQREHAPSSVAAASAQSAAQSPATEREGIAQANQTETMAAQQTNPFDRQAFKTALLAKVREITPANLGEADSFQHSGRAGEIRRDVSGQVQSGTSQAAGGVPAATSATPDTSSVPPRVAEPMQSDAAGPAPDSIPSRGAVQAPRPNDQVDLDHGPQQIDSTMAQGGVTTEQLQRSNEPTFTGAVAATDQARQHSATAPTQFRAEETAALGAERQQTSVLVGGDLQRMHAGRAGVLGQATGQQNDARTQTEQARQNITSEINRRFAALRTSVEGRLAQVETDANREFDTGSETARQNFEQYVGTRMDAYKDDRYSGALGWTLWLKDKVMSMPSEVDAFYTEGRDAYLAEMDAVIERVATIVETGLTAATTMIQEGRTAIHEYVTSLPENLRSIGQTAEQSLADQFTQLEQSVSDRRDRLIDSLAQRYVANVQAIDDRISAMQAENRGLVDAALGAITGVINTIRSLANTLMNVLSRAASAIGMIIRDPIGFLGNLVSAIGQGLRQFINNIGRYLIQGLMGWLFGALASAGIQMPTTFDLRSILGLVLQVLGLTYANFRRRAVAILGEGVVRALETTAEVFRVLITEGPAGLWRWISAQFEALKEQMISQIREFVMERVIMAGIQWIIGLLNPASAFVRACLAIKDIVVFFIERGSQILALVNAIIDSVVAIAQGNLTAAANWVENALARSVPVLISLLASILGLGGISDRIRTIIERIQNPINQIIDSVIRGAASLVRTVGRALGFGRQPENQSPSETVKALASARMTERLTPSHSLADVRTVMGQILAELRPQGLLNLELGAPDQEGESAVLASASETVPIGKIKKVDQDGRSVSVAMVARMVVSQPPILTNNLTQTDSSGRDLIQTSLMGGRERMANVRPVLGQVESVTPTEVRTRTFNGIRAFSDIQNQTHAEHHFISWLRSEEHVRSNMTRLEVQLNPLAPCGPCSDELSDLVAQRKHENSLFTAHIEWTRLYVNPDDDHDYFLKFARLQRTFDTHAGPGTIPPNELEEARTYNPGRDDRPRRNRR
ncbi:MAG: DUF4157 domain-containing protein [Fimbriimonas sp.]|nr:DUF4157 domain-containing protein [Fimbriimonas sp.]